MNATKASSRPIASKTPLHPTWSFLTNYAVVLVYVALHPDSTVRAIAQNVGITERATLAILRDLDDEGIVDRLRSGRRNTYSLNFNRLSKLRRGGTGSPLTPRLFVDVVVKTLFEIATRRGMVVQHGPPRTVPEHQSQARAGSWGFFTNHLLILLAIARDGTQTVRDLATASGVTERAAVAILNQLDAAGVIARQREGRRNSYTIDFEAFRNFEGWLFDTWRIPEELIDVATNGIKMLASRP